jgi:hypothetical protein
MYILLRTKKGLSLGLRSAHTKKLVWLEVRLLFNVWQPCIRIISVHSKVQDLIGIFDSLDPMRLFTVLNVEKALHTTGTTELALLPFGVRR